MTYKANEVAKMFGLNTQRIYQFIYDGRLKVEPKTEKNKGVRITQKSLDDFSATYKTYPKRLAKKPIMINGEDKDMFTNFITSFEQIKARMMELEVENREMKLRLEKFKQAFEGVK